MRTTVAVPNPPQGEHEPEGERKRRLLELFHDWHDPIPAVIEATEEATILRSDVYELPPLRYWCKGRVAGYKCPRRVTVLPELPKSATGKVVKARLSALAIQ